MRSHIDLALADVADEYMLRLLRKVDERFHQAETLQLLPHDYVLQAEGGTHVRLVLLVNDHAVYHPT